MKLTRREFKFLNWAIGEAAAWRGSLVGNPDPTQLKNFDACIAECKRALKKVSPYRKEKPMKK